MVETLLQTRLQTLKDQRITNRRGFDDVNALRRCGVCERTCTDVAAGVLRESGRAVVDGLDLETGWLFWSPCSGNGKTLAMGHLCLRHWKHHVSLLDDGPDCLSSEWLKWADSLIPQWVSMVAVLFRIRECYNSGGNEDDVIGPLRSARVLCIDDVGVNGRDHERNILYTLLESRSEIGKVTLMTSNLSLEQMAETFDARIASRIRGLCKPLQFTEAKDYRQA